MKNKATTRSSATTTELATPATATTTQRSKHKPNKNSNQLQEDDEVPITLVTRDKEVITPRLLLPRPKTASTNARRKASEARVKGSKVQDGNRSHQATTPTTARTDRKHQNLKRKSSNMTDDDDNGDHITKAAKSAPEHTPSRRIASPGIQDTSIDRPRNIEQIVYGRYKITAWYYSPFPSEFGKRIDEIFICEHCLKYMAKDNELRAHRIHCKKRRPPGRVIYEEGLNKVYEVDGREHKLYCQNLCLMSKLFLETKTLYYDVEGFTFYVLTEKDRSIDLFVGYFSKEKVSYDNYNLACIMTLPSHQRKGYGRLLIELSYELSKREGVLGSPEKPLSTLGSLGYRSFWGSTLVSVLRGFRGDITIQELSNRTGIQPDDVIFTLSWLGMLKYWKKDLVPVSGDGDLNDGDKQELVVELCIDKDMVETAITQHRLKLTRRLDPSLIRWQ